METDDKEIVPAFIEVKYMFSSTTKREYFKYDAIGEKVMNMFELLHEKNTKRWIANTMECGVSWNRIFFICISVLSYQPGIAANINVLDDGDYDNRIVEIKNMSKSAIAKKISKQKPSLVSDSVTVYKMPDYSISVMPSDTSDENPLEPCNKVSAMLPATQLTMSSSMQSNFINSGVKTKLKNKPRDILDKLRDPKGHSLTRNCLYQAALQNKKHSQTVKR